jgi:glutamate-1-semialdehyde aminotransferase
MPIDGYLEGLRAITEESGSMLIFDEAKTGFRMGLGGAAKSMGNGYPIAAIGGRQEVMSAWAEGGVMQAGTYSGNSIGAAATIATIGELSAGAPYAPIDRVGNALMAPSTVPFRRQALTELVRRFRDPRRTPTGGTGARQGGGRRTWRLLP